MKKNYVFEAEYIQVIVNWRQACDERGLSQLHSNGVATAINSSLRYLLDNFHSLLSMLSVLSGTRRLDLRHHEGS